MKYIITLTLLLLPVFLSAQQGPPDKPLSPQKWVEKMNYGSWWIFNIPPEKDNAIKVANYSPRIIDSLQALGINGGRLHWQAKNMFDKNNHLYTRSLDFVEKMVDDFMERDMAICLQISFGDKDMSPEIKQRYYNGWKEVSERMKNKSHLLAMCPVIEFHGWENDTYNGKPLTRKMLQDSLNRLYDTLTVIFREDNPTRIMSYKPWGAAKNAEFETLDFPFGNDPASDSGKPFYYIASFSGSYGIGHWEKWYPGMPADELQALKDETMNGGRSLVTKKGKKRLSGINAALKFRENTGIPFWCDHWEPNYWGKSKKKSQAKGKKVWSIKQNIAYTEFFMDTLKAVGSGGAGLQTRRFWNDKTNDFYREHPGMTESEEMSVEVIKLFRKKAREAKN
ncbi:MAG: hypothetical protein GXO47_00815 [Chlorobi bacterium]|nr:hypothetical protein [Chlorobiota bacterium]